MRIVFFGATDLGYRCCERTIALGHQVVAIFTIPQEFRISYAGSRHVRNVQYRDFHELGRTHGAPVIEVEPGMARYREAIASFRPDLLLVIGWYYMLPRSVRELAPRGCVGLHASLLPRYRGGAPLVWAMINGEKETGVTLFHFADGVDDGDIIGQERFAIAPTDTIADVLENAAAASLRLLERCLPRLADGSAPRFPQDHAAATTVPQRSPADGMIDWSWSAERIRNFIRAQTRPYPGAFTVIKGKRVTLWDADVVEDDVEANDGEAKDIEEPR